MTVIKELATAICTEFAPDMDPSEIPVDLDLIESGVIDSLGILKLIAYLENEFDITISPEELDIELYRSLSDIDALIARKRSALAA